MIDRFSKMVRVAPCKQKGTSATLSARLFYDHWVRYYGIPTSIFSDRDSRFTAAFWTSLFEMTGTRLVFTYGAHPRANG